MISKNYNVSLIYRKFNEKIFSSPISDDVCSRSLSATVLPPSIGFMATIQHFTTDSWWHQSSCVSVAHFTSMHISDHLE